jgi:hypothetical protein
LYCSESEIDIVQNPPRPPSSAARNVPLREAFMMLPIPYDLRAATSSGQKRRSFPRMSSSRKGKTTLNP